jgi:hypothetical protein
MATDAASGSLAAMASLAYMFREGSTPSVCSFEMAGQPSEIPTGSLIE